MRARDRRYQRTQYQPCPYCGAETNIVESTVIYGPGRDYGWVLACSRFPACDSYVGCHKGTKNPKGRLADKDLRKAKSEVHRLFDPMWQAKMQKEGCSRKDARTAAYLWLALQMRLSYDDCHVGKFDLRLCAKAIEILSPYYKPKVTA